MGSERSDEDGERTEGDKVKRIHQVQLLASKEGPDAVKSKGQRRNIL